MMPSPLLLSPGPKCFAQCPHLKYAEAMSFALMWEATFLAHNKKYGSF
jgi:hypothetical protein